MPTFRCPDCGKKISTEAKSCPKCGREIKFEDLPQNKPKKKMPRWGKILVGIVVVLWGLFFLLASHEPSPEVKAKNLQAKYDKYTMGDYCKDPKSSEAILDKFMADNSVPAEERTQMAACLSTKAHTNGVAVKASKGLEECNADRQKSPKKYKSYINLEPFYDQFTSRDKIGASYVPLYMAAKNACLVPDSFKAVGTMAELELDRKPPSALVSMNYKAKNAFGVEIPGRVSIRVNLLDLSWKEVKE